MARNHPYMTERQMLEQKVHIGRNNLLLAIILTVVNVVLLLTGSETMLLFSISVPYYAVIFGYVLEVPALLAVGCAIGAVILLAYLLCWLFSKKHAAWMTVALVLLILDTLALIGFYLLIVEFSGVLDLVIHVVLIYYVAAAVRAKAKLKAMPSEEEELVEAAPADPQAPGFAQFSTPLRRAEDVKHRVLLEGTYGSYQVVYRRVKRVNELVINGYVYDEYEALAERAHCLSANIEGHTIEMGFDGVSASYFRVDGQVKAKKTRLY